MKRKTYEHGYNTEAAFCKIGDLSFSNKHDVSECQRLCKILKPKLLSIGLHPKEYCGNDNSHSDKRDFVMVESNTNKNLTQQLKAYQEGTFHVAASTVGQPSLSSFDSFWGLDFINSIYYEKTPAYLNMNQKDLHKFVINRPHNFSISKDEKEAENFCEKNRGKSLREDDLSRLRFIEENINLFIKTQLDHLIKTDLLMIVTNICTTKPEKLYVYKKQNIEKNCFPKGIENYKFKLTIEKKRQGSNISRQVKLCGDNGENITIGNLQIHREGSQRCVKFRFTSTFLNNGLVSYNGDAPDAVPVASSESYGAMKVPELKALLKERGLKVGGKKAELVARLRLITDKSY